MLDLSDHCRRKKRFGKQKEKEKNVKSIVGRGLTGAVLVAQLAYAYLCLQWQMCLFEHSGTESLNPDKLLAFVKRKEKKKRSKHAKHLLKRRKRATTTTRNLYSISKMIFVGQCKHTCTPFGEISTT